MLLVFLVFLFTDAFDFQVDSLQKGKEASLESFSAIARQLKRQGYHVIIMHILDPYEIEFPFDQLALFEGLEGEDPIKIDADGIRDAYLKEMNTFCEQFKHKSLSGAVSYIQCRTDLSLQQNLLRMLEEMSVV